MIQEVQTEGLPLKMWVDTLDKFAWEEANNLASLPFAFRHIALMPDAHAGKGMPIGGVLATKNVVVPNAVGVDIGCGMCAVKTFDPMINIAHNYAAKETHFGEQVIVHRKGAVHAGHEEIGIIPGSQGTNSYIVKGLGNPDSFCSSSHGAGRVLSRTEAFKTLSLEDEIAHLDKMGVVHAVRFKQDLEEATGAYKDIREVMKNQIDLVTPIIELSPIAVIKG